MEQPKIAQKRTDQIVPGDNSNLSLYGTIGLGRSNNLYSYVDDYFHKLPEIGKNELSFVSRAMHIANTTEIETVESIKSIGDPDSYKSKYSSGKLRGKQIQIKKFSDFKEDESHEHLSRMFYLLGKDPRTVRQATQMIVQAVIMEQNDGGSYNLRENAYKYFFLFTSLGPISEKINTKWTDLLKKLGESGESEPVEPETLKLLVDTQIITSWEDLMDIQPWLQDNADYCHKNIEILTQYFAPQELLQSIKKQPEHTGTDDYIKSAFSFNADEIKLLLEAGLVPNLDWLHSMTQHEKVIELLSKSVKARE